MTYVACERCSEEFEPGELEDGCCAACLTTPIADDAPDDLIERLRSGKQEDFQAKAKAA